MSRKLKLSLALCAAMALATAAVAAAEKPITVKAGNLVLTVERRRSPRRRCRRRRWRRSPSTSPARSPPPTAPIPRPWSKRSSTPTRTARSTPAGSPPANRASSRRNDREAEKVCKAAIVGTGTTDVEVRIPRIHPRFRSSRNCSPSTVAPAAGKTTIYIHAFLTSPVTAALVTTVKITKVKNGRYGIRSIATIPKIAGGVGSVTAFSLTFPKKLFAYKGKKHGYLLAKCADGTLPCPGRSQVLRRHQGRPGEDRPRLHAEGLSIEMSSLAAPTPHPALSRRGVGACAGTQRALKELPAGRFISLSCPRESSGHPPFPGRARQPDRPLFPQWARRWRPPDYPVREAPWQ